MLTTRHRGIVAGILVFGLCVVSATTTSALARPPALEGPVGGDDGAPPLSPPNFGTAQPAPTTLIHEAIRLRSPAGVPLRAPKAPPAPIAESPTDDRPSDLARWAPGYWMWDVSRDDFTWVSGIWRVPPRERFWVDGRWARDANGWSRLPGYWSPRQAMRPSLDGFASQVAARPQADWHRLGPPLDHPEDELGPAPAPDAFYVAGHYAPSGDQVAWKPGFWAQSRPGYEWLPARWVRRPDDWAFRPGSWARETTADGMPTPARLEPSRRTFARPPVVTLDPLPPPASDEEPGLPRRNVQRDSNDEAADVSESGAPGARPPVIVGPPLYAGPYPPPPARRIYVMPPGYGPRYYDPLGVVPPFARRIIDRFAP